MATPVLDLDGIKTLYKKGVQHAKNKFSSLFYSGDDKLFDYQQSLIDKAQDMPSVMNAIWIPNNTWASSFKAPKPICTGCELRHTGIQFGMGHIGWYFLYGVTGNYAFNLDIFRLEIAPPEVVNIDRGEAVRWMVSGGYGLVGGKWYTIQSEWIYMKYKQTDYASFSLNGYGKNISISFFSEQPMVFEVVMNYTDTEAVKHHMQISMQANTGPTANMPNSCACQYGLGSLYYSYTTMNTVLTVDNTPPQGGLGWIDHQIMKLGIPEGAYIQALQTIANAIKKTVTDGWLWFAIQDTQSGLQYMLTHFFQYKFYQDDIKLNQNIEMQLVNVYKDGVPYFMPTEVSMDSSQLQVVMTATIPVNGVNLPAAYSITLPGGKQVVLKMACTQANVYPIPGAPAENVGILYDSTGKICGTGVLEANGYFTSQITAQRYIQQAGGNPADQTTVSIVMDSLNKPQTDWQKFLAFVFVLIPLWILILVIVFILYRKDSRHTRLMLSVALLLVLWVVLA